MKRSVSEPNLADKNQSTKRSKSIEKSHTREYLQLALAKVLDLQREMKEDSDVIDNTSDLGDSESEEDTMKEVLIKVFKDLPGSSPSIVPMIEKAIKQENPQLHAIRCKSIQLAGYDTCRRVALNFMKTVVKSTPTLQDRSDELLQHEFCAANNRGLNWIDEANVRRVGGSSSDYEIRMRMLRSLDLHLAVKQRDYVAKLMESGETSKHYNNI